MRVAVWDILPSQVFSTGTSRGRDVSFVSLPMERCAGAVADGKVDVALVPILEILLEPEQFDVMPAVALSSWSFPFAKIVLKRGLGSQLRSLAYPRLHEQAAFIARVVLREHYQSEPNLVASEERSPLRLALSDEDAYLAIGPNVPSYQPEPTTLDLGQEWYELANYPMVWGLFVTGRGDGSPGIIRALRDAVVQADDLRSESANAKEIDDPVRRFIRDELRLRLDDLALASLTELTNYVYYYGLTKDICTIPFVSLPEEDEDNGAADAAPLV